MAYASPFIRLSFGGDMAAGQEIWSCNVHLIEDGATSGPSAWFAEQSSLIAAYGGAITSFVSHEDTRVPVGVALKWAKMALIGTDGLYMEEPVEIPLTATGDATGGYIPQAALVNTLVSEVWKDPGRYNRFYLPIAPPEFSGDYWLTTNAQNAYADQLDLFIENLNIVGTEATVTNKAVAGVVSNTRSGSSNRVVAVRVGRVIDTQRRRRNGLTESYVDREIGV